MSSFKRIVQLVTVVGLVVVFSVFAFQNSQQISLHFMNKRAPEMPLFIILFIALFFGLTVAGVFGIAEVWLGSSRLRKKQKEIDELTKQLNALKSQPTLDDINREVEATKGPLKILPAENKTP